MKDCVVGCIWFFGGQIFDNFESNYLIDERYQYDSSKSWLENMLERDFNFGLRYIYLFK